MRRQLINIIKSVKLAPYLHLPDKEMTVDEYCRYKFAGYVCPKTIIYPSHLVEEKAPKSIETEISFKFTSQYNRIVPEAFVLVLENAIVSGSQGAVFTKENIVLKDVSREFMRYHTYNIWEKPHFNHPLKIDGTIAVLTGHGGSTYYHWLFDVLPRLHLVQKAGLFNRVDKFILPPIEHSYQREMLDMLGLPRSKWMEASSSEFFVTADRVIVPSLPSVLGTVNKWTNDFLQQAFVKDAKPSTHSKRIFISRRHAPNRKLLNEDKIIEVLAPLGFEILEAENLSFAEQVDVFRNAEIVAGPHGAGFSNTAFCKEGTRVIEFFCSDNIVPCYWSIANNNKLDYYFIMDGEKDNLFFQPYWDGLNRDFTVPVEKLKTLLQEFNIS